MQLKMSGRITGRLPQSRAREPHQDPSDGEVQSHRSQVP